MLIHSDIVKSNFWMHLLLLFRYAIFKTFFMLVRGIRNLSYIHLWMNDNIKIVLSTNFLSFQALNGFLMILTCEGEVFFATHSIESYLGFHQVKSLSAQLPTSTEAANFSRFGDANREKRDKLCFQFTRPKRLRIDRVSFSLLKQTSSWALEQGRHRRCTFAVLAPRVAIVVAFAILAQNCMIYLLLQNLKRAQLLFLWNLL